MADLSALGSSPRLVVAMLTRAGVSRGARVLDLACGKGAVGIAVARGLGAEVTGVDGFGAFIDGAREAAERAGVAGRCEFRVQDVRKVRPRDRFDVVMMLGLFGVEGSLPILRRCVRPGGVFVLDDATCAEGEGDDEGLTRSRARGLIEAGGDAIVEVWRQTPGAARRQNDALYARLKGRVDRLARETPSLREDLRAFLRGQRHANRLLAGSLRSTIWVVRRSAKCPD